MKLIGIAGYAGAGKNTFADFISQALAVSKVFTFQVSFAQEIKKLVLTKYNISADWLARKNEIAPGMKHTMRELYQFEGTEAGRNFKETVWIDKLQQYIKQDFKDSELWLITDVRFQNEADWILNNGGLVFRIHREGVGPESAHPSEQEVTTMKASDPEKSSNFIDIFNYQGDLAGLQRTAVEVTRDHIIPHFGLAH